jgi:hypothetical protein
VNDHNRIVLESTPEGQEQAAEMRARTCADPPTTIEISPPAVTDAEADLIRRLRTAKRAGDFDAIREIEEDLATLRGEPIGNPIAPEADSELRVVAAGGEEAPPADRWLPHEFLLAGTELPELRPTMASDADGNLYAAFEEVTEEYGRTCAIYRSTDGGEHWERYQWLVGADLIKPSIAIAEGAEDWLFVAFNRIDQPSIYVFRQNLDNPSLWDFTEIHANPPGMSSPRIVTDCAEYPAWYVYLVYNARAVDNWVIMHSRTTNGGDSWVPPEIVAGYCGFPDEFYDASEAHPDIEYGSDNVHIAFDNYPPPCTITSRDIFMITSEDFGSTWVTGVRLSGDLDDEHDPAVASVKNYDANPTTVVAYTRFYDALDNDIWYAYTQNDGTTWDVSNCIACTTEEEKYVNLVTSYDHGAIHAAFWDEFNIDHAVADYLAPAVWTREDSISTSDTASDIEYRPGILVDRTMPAGEEAGVAWTDFRNVDTADEDIYYDAVALPHAPDDFYLYTTYDPGLSYTTAIDGFVDEVGAIEGNPGAEYLFFESGDAYEGDHTAYVYRVETDGDPDRHPDNPYNTGPVAPRTFTFVSSHYLGNYASGHDNAFYVDETGIYYGASDNPRNSVDGWGTYMGGGIFHWDFDWNLLECVVPTPAPGGTQTLARNAATGEWWAGTGNRRLYKWDGASWVYQFTHPHLGGSHHDGMEIINNSLYISDMTSDVIIRYRLDDAGNVIDASGNPANTFFYSASPSVEGMGHEPNDHIWIAGYGSRNIYEIGGGALQLVVEGIPDQCVLPEDPFDTFDLDDYVVGIPPYSWSWEGNVDLVVEVDAENLATVTYPPGWTGQETITFTVEDDLGTRASDDATFTVSEAPVVGDIPDQTAPFVPFDLDDYLAGADPEMVTWTAAGMSCLLVEIDATTHVATVTNPGSCVEPEVITFTATVTPCGEGFSDEDGATFDPGTSGVEDEISSVLALGPVVPNPCSRETQINYSIPIGIDPSTVTLAIYDVEGRRVRALVGAGEAAATDIVTWDGHDDQGMPVPSGTYFLQLNWGRKRATVRVLLLR